MPEVQVMVRSVYGKIHIYPVNENAKCFCRLTGTKTLSEGNLKIIQELGFKIVQVESYKLNLLKE